MSIMRNFSNGSQSYAKVCILYRPHIIYVRLFGSLTLIRVNLLSEIMSLQYNLLLQEHFKSYTLTNTYRIVKTSLEIKDGEIINHIIHQNTIRFLFTRIARMVNNIMLCNFPFEILNFKIWLTISRKKTVTFSLVACQQVTRERIEQNSTWCIFMLHYLFQHEDVNI